MDHILTNNMMVNFVKISQEVSRYELDAHTSKKLFRAYKDVFLLVFEKISMYAEE